MLPATHPERQARRLRTPGAQEVRPAKTNKKEIESTPGDRGRPRPSQGRDQRLDAHPKGEEVQQAIVGQPER